MSGNKHLQQKSFQDNIQSQRSCHITVTGYIFILQFHRVLFPRDAIKMLCNIKVICCFLCWSGTVLAHTGYALRWSPLVLLFFNPGDSGEFVQWVMDNLLTVGGFWPWLSKSVFLDWSRWATHFHSGSVLWANMGHCRLQPLYPVGDGPVDYLIATLVL